MKRVFLKTIAILFAASSFWPVRSFAEGDWIGDAAKRAESNLSGKVGVAVIDTGSKRSWLYRSDERFPMASTSKAFACAALLAAGDKFMKSPITITDADLLEYAPVTKTLLGRKVLASELCGIALRTSDNTAINKVLEVLGGPSYVTSFLKTIGDNVTRLDRNEPSLNEATPGDLRDTTTPLAAAQSLQKLVLGPALSRKNRDELTAWLGANEVGGPLLRAGIPADWQIVDRTGAGGFGTRGVIAVMWPPGHTPIVAAVYLTETKASMAERNDAISSIGKAIAETFKQK